MQTQEEKTSTDRPVAKMTRERWLNLFKHAHENAVAQGVAPIDWDDPDGLKVVVSQGACLIPMKSEWILVLDEECGASWVDEIEGESWPWFENELRSRLS